MIAFALVFLSFGSWVLPLCPAYGDKRRTIGRLRRLMSEPRTRRPDRKLLRTLRRCTRFVPSRKHKSWPTVKALLVRAGI